MATLAADIGPPVAELIPARPSLKKLREVAAGCHACHLHRDATQTCSEKAPRAPSSC